MAHVADFVIERLKELDAVKSERDALRAEVERLQRDNTALHEHIQQLQPSAPPVDLDAMRDPNFTGGLDPVEYLRRLHEGEL